MPWSKLAHVLGIRRQIDRDDLLTSTAATIIVPLYIYPHPDTWKPLYESVTKFPNSRFLVIINPGNGPGPDPIPDTNYLEEIPKLTAYDNVDVVGYVHTTFARRDISAVLNDIRTYSNWNGRVENPGLRVCGIFVDETPNQYDDRVAMYLQQISDFVRGCSGFGGRNLVIFNPGCVPTATTPRDLEIADITVIFEDTWHTFNTRIDDGIFTVQEVFGTTFASAATCIASSDSTRDKLAMIIHSVPQNLEPEQMRTLVKQVKGVAGAVFVTDLTENYYSNWSPKWSRWVDMISNL